MNCAYLDAELCEILPFCELADDGSCVESDWDGGDWDGGDHDGGGMHTCADLDAEHCDLVPFCELTDDGSCVESEWDGGDWDGGDHDGGGMHDCADLDAEMCQVVPFCELLDDGSCVETDWEGNDWDGGWHDDFDFNALCAHFDEFFCDMIPFCALNDAGECVASDWGWGDCGSGDDEFGYGDWNWEDGGFSLGDINIDELVNVQDIIKEVSFILEEVLPNDYESWAGDLNVDEVLNVLDIVDMVEAILGSRVSSCHSAAILSGSTLKVQGAVAAIQADAVLISKIEGDDILASANGKSVIYNLSGILDTDEFTFANFPNGLIVAGASGEEVKVERNLPNSLTLGDAYPNPFNPSTTFSLALSKGEEVLMQVVNVKGQVVSTLVDGYLNAGSYSLVWDAHNMTSGMYLLKVQSAGVVHTQKLMLVK